MLSGPIDAGIWAAAAHSTELTTGACQWRRGNRDVKSFRDRETVSGPLFTAGYAGHVAIEPQPTYRHFPFLTIASTVTKVLQSGICFFYPLCRSARVTLYPASLATRTVCQASILQGKDILAIPHASCLQAKYKFSHLLRRSCHP